jgi:dynein heavy chain
MIPERGTIYDFCFEKKGSGNWIEWMDTLDRSLLTVPKDAKVSLLNRRI